MAKTAPTRESGSSEERGFRHFLPVVFLACATFLAYSSALNGTWALDDAAIGRFTSIENALNLHLGYRKIAYLSFLANRWIDPVSPVNFRVTNILIHVCNALLVYIIALKTLGLPVWKEKYGEYRFSVSLLAATIFALHPININAVSYIVQRMASLSAMFTLLSLLSYIVARTSSSSTRSFALYGAALLFVVCGIFSKENAIMAIPLIGLYDVVFFFGVQRRKHLLNMVLGLVLGLIALAASSVFLHFDKVLLDIGAVLIHPFRQIPELGWTATDVYWTPAEHVLTEFRVIGRYLFLLFFPLPRFLVFDWWDFPLSTGIFSPVTTLISLLVILSLISLAVVKMRKLPFLSFGILWYFIALSMESFVALGSDLYFEHRNYLPLAGLAFGVTAQAVVMTAGEPKRKTVWAIACVLALVLGGLTFQRNLVWKDSVTLWTDTIHKTGRNLRAMVALGNSYLRLSDVASAKEYYRQAMDVGMVERRAQFYQDSAYSVGMICLLTGDLEGARKVIVMLDKNIENPQKMAILKGFYHFSTGDIEKAIKEYTLILPSTDGLDRAVIYTLLGDAYRKKERPDEALSYYEKAVQQDPSFSAAFYGMGNAYLIKSDPEKAAYYMSLALKIDPNHVLALSDMAEILLTKKDSLEKAKAFAAKAVALNSVFYQPYLTMGNVLLVSGDDATAEGYFEKAAGRGAKDYMISFSKARIYFLRGDREKVKACLKDVLSMKDTPEHLRRMISAQSW